MLCVQSGLERYCKVWQSRHCSEREFSWLRTLINWWSFEHFYSAPVGERSIAISLSLRVSACLSVCEHISGTAGPIVTKFCVQILCGHGLFLLAALRYVIYFLFCVWCLAVVGQVGRPTTTTSVATPGRSLMSMNALCCIEIHSDI